MAANSISGTDKSVYKVGIMFIDSGILENIGVVVGIFGISLHAPEYSIGYTYVLEYPQVNKHSFNHIH